ncbi:hypothetical protein [Xylella fastidiosa]|uniref:Uncharacterized protein n=1 Tax=Xylella fastidiosa subsp. pauca TaxID=698414 RepID=I7D429_XYLFS|nr:hypothetical protein [Xylella fastidiosa]AFO67802.1 hypothetical protein [Xylella fastidiosa subsp. pauca]
MLSDHAWMHIYGIGGLILGLLSFFRNRILAWLTFRKDKKKQAIKKALDEIESISSQPFDPLHFAKEVTDCLVCFIFSVSLFQIATIMNFGLYVGPWMKTIDYLLYASVGLFLGICLGILSELRRKLNIKLDPQKATERLRAMLEKLD